MTDLTDIQLYAAAHAMRDNGGSFAHHIAQAFFHADKDNKERILSTFGYLFDQFHASWVEQP